MKFLVNTEINYVNTVTAFTVAEIEEIWFRIYGEDLKEDYPGFIEELEKEE